MEVAEDLLGNLTLQEAAAERRVVRVGAASMSLRCGEVVGRLES